MENPGSHELCSVYVLGKLELAYFVLLRMDRIAGRESSFLCFFKALIIQFQGRNTIRRPMGYFTVKIAHWNFSTFKPYT